MLCLFFLLACTSQVKRNKMSGDEMMNSLLENHTALSHDLADVDTNFLYAVHDAVGNDFSGLIYVADGGCSFCIKNLLSYQNQIIGLQSDPVLNVIASKNNLDVIQYYLDMSESRARTNYYILDKKQGQLIESMDYSGLLLCFNKGKVENVAFYFGEV